MQRNLHDHIMDLELQIQRLRDRLTDPAVSPAERNRIELDIRTAQLALAYYRKAFDLERQIA